MDLSEKELGAFLEDRIVEGILRVRQGSVQVKPGYDGVYGQVNIFGQEIPPVIPSSQLSFF
jgi:PHP family Zn ribbon phosphoesterase